MLKRVKKIQKNKQVLILALFACILPITTIAFTYGALKTSNPVNTISKGIVGDTVYVSDATSDYYYYTGQNYTHSTNSQLPSLDNKNYYNDSNLVKVKIIYDGTSYDGNHTGYVSLTERQSKFVYEKYYPVENNEIEIRTAFEVSINKISTENNIEKILDLPLDKLDVEMPLNHNYNVF